MSLSEDSNLITDWIKNGLEFHYVYQPTTAPFILQPNEMHEIPSERYIFRAPEGVAITLTAAFDSPYCGVRFETTPHLDTGTIITINNMIQVGSSNMPLPVVALVPPQTPNGIYVATNRKDWAWLDWAKLYVFNADPVNEHYCLGYEYNCAMLDKPRPISNEKLLLYLELYPAFKKALLKKLKTQATEDIVEMGIAEFTLE